MSASAHRSSTVLEIAAAGLCCAVGYHLGAASCALRANMDHFQDSHFVTDTGAAIKVAPLPDADCWGSERVARWAALAIEDCLRAQHGFDAARTALLMLAPEPERPDMAASPYAAIITLTARQLDLRFHGSSRILPLGRAGLAAALGLTFELLDDGAVEQVLLVGADSLLNTAAIEHYLRDERLMVPGNRDGFLPGEAAGAVLLRRHSPTAGRGALLIGGWSEGSETGRPDGSVPSRVQGLTAAVRAACARAGVAPDALQFRLGDQNGEVFFAKEAANAFTRLMARGAMPEQLTLADKLGEIGSATGPAALAWLSELMPRADTRPGTLGVVHLANDDGLRCAVVLHQT